MTPIKLVLDDDPIVRKLVMKYVNSVKDFVTKNVDKKYVTKVMGPNVSKGDDSVLQPLKAQEELIDCYICIFAEKNKLKDLICLMIRLALSSWIDGKGKEFADKQDEEVSCFLLLRYFV